MIRPLAAAAAWLSLGLCAAQAGQFSVSPVLIEMRSPDKASTLTLKNNADQSLGVQLRVFLWQQSNGEEQLLATDDLVLSPPIANVPPFAEQIVRIVDRRSGAIEAERSYRVFVDELPAQVGPQSERQVNVLLRYSLPVFIQSGRQGEVARPVWKLSQQGQDLTLAVRNEGKRRLRLSEVRIETPDGAIAPFGSGLLGYVLAGSERHWTGQLQNNGSLGKTGTVQLWAVTDRGDISETVPFSQAP